MGLRDQISASLGEGKQINYFALLGWFNAQGGISGLLAQFRQAGFSEQVASWISLDENQTLDAAQIEQALSAATLDDLSNKLGLPTAETCRFIAEFMPKIVDKLSPNGLEPQNGDIMMLVMALLKK